MRITSKGQVTTPTDIRERAGLLPHTQVELQFDGKVVRIVEPKLAAAGARASPLVCEGVATSRRARKPSRR